MYNIIIPGGEIKYMEAMRYVQTVYLAGDSRAAAKLLRRLLLMQSEKAYPFSGGYAFLLLFRHFPAVICDDAAKLFFYFFGIHCTFRRNML